MNNLFLHAAKAIFLNQIISVLWLINWFCTHVIYVVKVRDWKLQLHVGFLVVPGSRYSSSVMFCDIYEWSLALLQIVGLIKYCRKSYFYSFMLLYWSIILFVWFCYLQLGIETVPVLIGPVTYLLLSKPARGVEKSFSPLSLLERILPVYK